MAATEAKFCHVYQTPNITRQLRSAYGRNTKLSVEKISLFTSLGSTSLSCSLGRGASILGSLISAARVGEGVADELGNNANSLGRTVVE